MMTRLKYKVTPKSVEEKPSLSPTAVDSADTAAAWELGMPPVSKKRRKFQRRWATK
jgi:hypothetical protein